MGGEYAKLEECLKMVISFLESYMQYRMGAVVHF